MNNKELINKLTCVASALIEDDYVNCDVVIDKESISLCNWHNDVVTTSALCHIANLCKKFDLLIYVDFYQLKIVIHG